MTGLRRDISHESAFRPAERLRHGHLLAYDIQERPGRHARFQPLFNVETDLYQQVNNQPHIIALLLGFVGFLQ
jgi:hypothetical protein